MSSQCPPQRSIFIICSIFILNLNAWAQSPVSLQDAVDKPTDPVVEMEPYIVKGERILPPPESWFYINIPAMEVKRAGRVVYAPGYEILSARSRNNSLVLAGELQLRQAANALVFPDLVSTLPRTAVIVVLDDGRLRDNTRARNWEGDSLYTATALRQSNGQPDARYSIGTQITTHFNSDFVMESPSQYAENVDRETPDTHTLIRNSRTNDIAKLVSIAANGGPLTVYLDDTRPSYGRLISGDDFVGSTKIFARPGSILDDKISVDGTTPESVFGRELSQRLVLLGRQITRSNDPKWLSDGFGRLCKDIQVTARQVVFGEFPEYIKIKRVPKLADVLDTKPQRSAVPYGDLMASVFIHYCLYADDGARSAQFTAFIKRLETEPFSEKLFEECFGQKLSAFQSAVIAHWHLMTSQKRLLFKWDTPPLPDIVARNATQSEVARLKAELLIAHGQSPKALDELRIAYWRGEREAWMLALLALLEEHIGSIPRAEKITKMLLTLPQVPARAYVVAAKLRMREFGITEENGKKLNKTEADSLMTVLLKARTSGLIDENFCATLSLLILHSAESPPGQIVRFIEEAATRYPLNRTIAAARKLASP